jgi:hypothetical protein
VEATSFRAQLQHPLRHTSRYRTARPHFGAASLAAAA